MDSMSESQAAVAEKFDPFEGYEERRVNVRFGNNVISDIEIFLSDEGTIEFCEDLSVDEEDRTESDDVSDLQAVKRVLEAVHGTTIEVEERDGFTSIIDATKKWAFHYTGPYEEQDEEGGPPTSVPAGLLLYEEHLNEAIKSGRLQLVFAGDDLHLVPTGDEEAMAAAESAVQEYNLDQSCKKALEELNEGINDSVRSILSMAQHNALMSNPLKPEEIREITKGYKERLIHAFEEALVKAAADLTREGPTK